MADDYEKAKVVLSSLRRGVQGIDDIISALVKENENLRAENAKLRDTIEQMTKKSEVKICDTTIDETQLSTDDSSIDLGSSFEPESPNVFNEFHGRSAPSYTAIKHDVTKPYTSEGSVQKSIKRPKAENKLNFRLKSLKNKENNRMTQSKKVFENKYECPLRSKENNSQESKSGNYKANSPSKPWSSTNTSTDVIILENSPEQVVIDDTEAVHSRNLTAFNQSCTDLFGTESHRSNRNQIKTEDDSKGVIPLFNCEICLGRYQYLGTKITEKEMFEKCKHFDEYETPEGYWDLSLPSTQELKSRAKVDPNLIRVGKRVYKRGEEPKH